MLDGAGEPFGVIDSGISENHPDLDGRIAPATAFRAGRAGDSNGHGTHVAGVIAGTGASSGQAIMGVAPGARIVSVGFVKADGSLELPIDLGELLSIPYEAGATLPLPSPGSRIPASGSRAGGMRVTMQEAAHEAGLPVYHMSFKSTLDLVSASHESFRVYPNGTNLGHAADGST